MYIGSPADRFSSTALHPLLPRESETLDDGRRVDSPRKPPPSSDTGRNLWSPSHRDVRRHSVSLVPHLVRVVERFNRCAIPPHQPLWRVRSSGLPLHPDVQGRHSCCQIHGAKDLAISPFHSCLKQQPRCLVCCQSRSPSTPRIELILASTRVVDTAHTIVSTHSWYAPCFST